MITVAQCATYAGLAANEIVLGASPARRHEALLSSYLLNLHRDPDAVREMIVSDLRGFLDLGARDCAADLLLVLRVFLSKYPEARRAAPANEEAVIIPFVLDDPFRPGLTGRSREVEDRSLPKSIERASIAQRQMKRNRNKRS